ncbi:MAG: hypothetical protein ACFFBI_03210 [Promethearchaeota archaeon]
MKLRYFLISSFAIGIIITLITGLFSHPTEGIIGVNKWGYPFYWLSQVVYPEAKINTNWSNLIIDVLIWIISTLLILKLLEIIIRNLKK